LTDRKKVIGRMVRINLWTDDKFPFLSDDAQLVWFHVYTNPLSNGLGLFHASVEGLAAQKRWTLERYRKGFGECLAKGLFEYDETLQIIYFKNFLKHNRPENPNVLKGLLGVWDYIPNGVFKVELHARICSLGKTFKEVMKTYDVTLPETFDGTLPQTYTETGTGTGTGTGSGTGTVKTLPYRREKLGGNADENKENFGGF